MILYPWGAAFAWGSLNYPVALLYPGTGYGYVAGLRAEALSMSDVYLNLDINKFIKLDT